MVFSKKNIVLIAFIAACLSSFCIKVHANPSTKLIFRIEERLIDSDEIYEYNVFTDGSFNKININNTNSESKLFSSEFKILTKKQLDKFKQYLSSLENLEYENDFPWKEDLYKRGNVYRIIFIDKVRPNYFNNSNTKQSSKELLVPKVFYYYEGHKESPEIFSEIVRELHKL